MRVLVTGGAGFIGSHVCDAFVARGDDVWALDDLSHGRVDQLPKEVKLVKETILNASQLSAIVMEMAPELICHLAAQVDVRASVASPGKDAEINIIGTINMLEAARLVNARLIFVSTGGALYGENAPVPSPESAPTEPGSPYGVAKYCAEQYVGLYNRMFGAEHAILRFANVYGPRQGASGEAGVVSIFCGNTIRGKSLTIYGDGKQTRDYVYVDDCVAALLAAADHGKAGVWNVGSGAEVNVLDLAALVGRLAGGNYSQPVFASARTGELSRSALACGRAKQDLGWRPVTSLTDGVQAVVSWLKADAPDRG
ncbi:MAG: NAD-dependent epimerase/dehydratase family protein [Trebonia sp.]